MLHTQVFYSLKRRFDDRDAKSPLNFKHISMLSFMLSSIGSWPHRQFGRRRLDFILSMYSMLLIFVAIVLLIVGPAYIWYNRETISFFDAGHVLLCIFLESLFLQRLLMARTAKYRDIIKDYLLEFHLFYFKNRSLYASKIHAQIHNISVIFTLYMICQMFCGLSLFTFMPWYNNYNNGMFGPDRPANRTFEQAVYYYCFTEDVYTTIKGYWVLFVFNIPTAYNTIIGVVAFDLLLSLIVFQIWGHLRILKHNLSSIIPKDGMYSPEENMIVREILKEIIEHHKFIIKFVDKCSDAFSEELFVFYLLMQLLTCTCLLEVSSLTADALAKYGPLTLGMHQQLIQVSILFEMISTKSEQLIDAVYAMPWQCMDSSNRKTVMVLLQRAQTPITLKAAKMVPVGLQTMAAVLKTSLSYYMMLNAVAGER
ncbi:odorant receptor 10a-like [Cydia splendana]|uniref:odorant receptor 10a-like n=1 Tax=Cydia splendana TaxID=1100963 RepID=UPI00213D462B